ncbi:MAG TPA: zf-HC2 domain-containing protein [Acidobacteriota bacterium]|nr:zf-HC2 domain-containing protein [Acidobacteriota bacterium]
MICLRYDLWRNMVPYLHGRLDPESVIAMEVHLADCNSCQNRLKDLQQTDALMQQLPKTTTGDLWPEIERAIAEPRTPQPRTEHRKAWAISAAAAAMILLLAFLGYESGQRPLSRADRTVTNEPEEFQEIALSEFARTDLPHVSTVGYVSEIKTDETDGDLVFKLVDNLQQPKHFIVCEIIPALKMDAPHPGTRIRVSGVHRFDSEAEHQWYEIHPVLSIEQVR